MLGLCFTVLGAFSAASPLGLAEALALADERNETPRIARARVDRARAQRLEAYSALLPTLTGLGTYTRRANEAARDVGGQRVIIQQLNALQASLSAQLTVLDPAGIALLRAAEHSIHSERLLADELRRAMAFEVAEAFFTVLAAEQLREAAGQRKSAAEAVVQDASVRQKAGLVTKNALTRSELELASAALILTQAENGVRTSRLGLGFLIDDSAERPLVPPPPAVTAPLASGEASALIAAAQAERQDLGALEARARAREVQAHEPWLRHLPRLGAGATARATNEAGLVGNTVDWNVTATLTWVIFDGGLRYAQAAARVTERDEARLSADALRRQIGLELRSALATLETAKASARQADVRVRVATQNAEETRQRFAAGLATALENVDAAVSEFDARAELVRQGFLERIAELALVRARGHWPLATEKTP